MTPLSMAGFASAKALSTRNDAPDQASRPFDKDRDGFVMGEGAGILVLEEYEHAKARGAKIYAEVKGYGSSDDAFHITAPKEDGHGPARAMEEALRHAGVDPTNIQYVNAHGTSTAYNDSIETTAIKRVCGDHAHSLAVNSTKSMIGHLLGGATAVELVVTALAVANGEVHPPGTTPPWIRRATSTTCPGGSQLVIENALCNSLGFGGHNVSICIGKVDLMTFTEELRGRFERAGQGHVFAHVDSLDPDAAAVSRRSSPMSTWIWGAACRRSEGARWRRGRSQAGAPPSFPVAGQPTRRGPPVSGRSPLVKWASCSSRVGRAHASASTGRREPSPWGQYPDAPCSTGTRPGSSRPVAATASVRSGR